MPKLNMTRLYALQAAMLLWRKLNTTKAGKWRSGMGLRVDRVLTRQFYQEAEGKGETNG